MGPMLRMPIRAALWFLAVFAALFPIATASKVPFYHPLDVAAAANSIGLFRDFYYIAIIITVASFCNVLYSFVKQAPNWLRALGIFVCLYYVFVLLYGSTRFAEIAFHGNVPLSDLRDDLIFVGLSVLITLATEVGIAFNE